MAGVEGRVIAVTGAGAGLGRAYALLLAHSGAKVVVNDLGGSRDGTGRSPSASAAVGEEIRVGGGEAAPSADSVATSEGGAAIVATALDAFGRIDGVVANAGILRDRALHKMIDEDWDAVQKAHLYGAFHVVHAAWPQFREQKHGRVVVATSTSGIYGTFGQSNYGAAKAGLIGLVQTLPLEGRTSNILCNAIAPLAATRRTADVAPQEVLDKLPPAHVAPVVVHLLSDEQTETGAVVVAGGGLVHRVVQFQTKARSSARCRTVAQVAERWAEVVNLDGAVPGRNPVS